MPPFSLNQQPKISNQEVLYEHPEDMLEELPNELQNFWKEKIKDLNETEAVLLLRSVIQQRKNLKEKLTTRYFGETQNEEVKKQLRITVDYIEKTFGDINYFLGNGSTAEVYEMPYNENICVKYLVNTNTKAYENTIREEALYLENMRNVRAGEIRTPDVYFYHKSDRGECYGMEKIHGLSLSIILEKPESFPKLKELASLSANSVLNNLKEYIDAMHKNGVAHHDLNMRNIMVDHNLNFYIIDFGRAKKLEIGERANEIYDSLTGADYAKAESAIKTFFSKIKNLTESQL